MEIIVLVVKERTNRIGDIGVLKRNNNKYHVVSTHIAAVAVIQHVLLLLLYLFSGSSSLRGTFFVSNSLLSFFLSHLHSFVSPLPFSFCMVPRYDFFVLLLLLLHSELVLQ